jgi:hypothetical protein
MKWFGKRYAFFHEVTKSTIEPEKARNLDVLKFIEQKCCGIQPQLIESVV